MKRKLLISSIIIITVLCTSVFPFRVVHAATDYEQKQAEYARKLNESVAYVMSLIDDNMTDYEKAYIFAQYCQEGNIYSPSSNDQTAEGVLVDHKAVCAGFASAFRLLCTTAGIPCETIISTKANHEWCLCYLDGEWTYVDVTRTPSGEYQPQIFSGKLFQTRHQLDFVTVKDENGSIFGTTGDMAIENGWEILESYFDDAYYNHFGLNDNYIPVGVEDEGEFNFSSSCSRVYYDENYKYYEERETLDTISKVYKENRTTGEKTKLADALCFDYATTGLVKDNNKIYYIGTDGSIYSMDINGNNQVKEFTHSGTENISGIFVQDGYIYYALRASETATDAELVQWKKLETAPTLGEYTVNNADSQYILNYIKTTKGIVISYCEGIGDNEPAGKLYIPDTIEGLPVIGIGEDAFYGLELTGEVTLPKNLQYIGKSAFRGTNITKVIWNEELTAIGENAFGVCENLTGILEMPDSIEYIDYRAFYNCNYENINFSDNLKMISAYAFYGNENLGAF